MKEDKEKKLQRATPTLYPSEAKFMNVQFFFVEVHTMFTLKNSFKPLLLGEGGGGRD
jgi:hypothetical protein